MESCTSPAKLVYWCPASFEDYGCDTRGQPFCVSPGNFTPARAIQELEHGLPSSSLDGNGSIRISTSCVALYCRRPETQHPVKRVSSVEFARSSTAVEGDRPDCTGGTFDVDRIKRKTAVGCGFRKDSTAYWTSGFLLMSAAFAVTFGAAACDYPGGRAQRLGAK